MLVVKKVISKLSFLIIKEGRKVIVKNGQKLNVSRKSHHPIETAL